MTALPATPTSEYPAYAGPMTGYLGTGFTFDWICRNDIVEDHPAIMRYEAFKHWANKTWPTRGTRPAGVSNQLSRLSGTASNARAVMTPTQELGYKERTAQRRVLFLPFDMRGEPWTGDPPALPHVSVPRGRSKVAIIERLLVRPARGWREQVKRDHEVLRTLGHAIPRSERPTQTVMGRNARGDRFELQAVPLMDAYHSWLSCRGKDSYGTPCPHCCKDNKHRAKRRKSEGRLEELVSYSPELDSEIAGG